MFKHRMFLERVLRAGFGLAILANLALLVGWRSNLGGQSTILNINYNYETYLFEELDYFQVLQEIPSLKHREIETTLLIDAALVSRHPYELMPLLAAAYRNFKSVLVCSTPNEVGWTNVVELKDANYHEGTQTILAVRADPSEGSEHLQFSDLREHDLINLECWTQVS